MKLTARSIKIFLKNRGIDLEESDDLIIDNYVHCAESCIKLRDILETEGEILDSNSPRGDVKKNKHPAFDMLSNRLKDLNGLANQLGLSPKARKELMKGVEVPKKTGFDLKRKAI